MANTRESECLPIVVTGGPGSGKTSLILSLFRRGVPHMPEAGRAVIRDQTRIGGQALPWADRMLFAELMLAHDLRSYEEARRGGWPVIMDRGIPDIIGYLDLNGLAVPEHLRRAAQMHPYHQRVFIAPFWDRIYERDEERRQDPREAEATCDVMRQTYEALGYSLVDLPLMDVEERAAFVLGKLAR